MGEGRHLPPIAASQPVLAWRRAPEKLLNERAESIFHTEI